MFKIAVLGVGNIGEQLTRAFSTQYNVVAYDHSKQRIDALNKKNSENFFFTSDESEIAGSDIFIVCVPTPVNLDKTPNLLPLLDVSRTLSKYLCKGNLVVYESTVYPGVIEGECLPLLEKVSELKVDKDFKLGYSPERINFGDDTHTLYNTTKVIAGHDAEALDMLSKIYGSVIENLFPVKSIKVAEAAKLLENTQRYLNISFLNEASMIFKALGINMSDVLEATSTKWNFVDCHPGLIGGPCINVNPHYLAYLGEAVLHQAEIIEACDGVNDVMLDFIMAKVTTFFGEIHRPLKDARVGVFGLTFKKNYPDISDSRVIDLVNKLKAEQINVRLYDPIADPDKVHEQYGLLLEPLENFQDIDVILIAVGHAQFKIKAAKEYVSLMNQSGGLIMDLENALSPNDFLDTNIRVWKL